MLKLLLVDDEAIVRSSMRKAIPWEAHDIQIIGEAGNGREALALIRDEKPDIVVSDIRMPLMNGLELAAEIKRSRLDVQIIFLTGYSDIEYLQDGIKIGVNDFLLKPVEASVLLDSINRLRLRHMEEEEKKQKLRFYQKIYNENTSLIKGAMLEQLLSGQVTGESFWKMMDSYRFLPPSPVYLFVCQTPENAPVSFSSLLALAFKECDISIFSATSGSCLAVFASLPSGISIDSFCQQLSHTECLSPLYEYTMLFAAANPVDASSLESQITQLCYAAERTHLFGFSERCLPLALGDKPDLPKFDTAQLRSLYYQLFLFLQSQSPGSPKALLQSLKNLLEKGCAGRQDLWQALSVFFLLMERPMDLESLFDQRFTLHTLFEKIDTLLSSDGVSETNGFMQECLLFVDQHICEKISTQQIAEHLNMSIGHFCRRFKTETGKSFIEWLHHAKIEKAKSIMQENHVKSYELASMLGYSDYKVFARYFLRYTGCSFREYQALHRNVKSMI